MNIAIVGVTGLVGQKFLEVLGEKKLKVKNYYLYASKNSAGKKIDFLGKEYKVLELCESNIRSKKIDYVLMSVEAELSRQYAPIFADVGATVIDNSSEWRMHNDIPLVVPEVNFDSVQDYHSIIANPNCSTIQAVVALAPLHKKFGIKRIVFSTYQAISGAGQNPKFAYPIENNILPHIDKFTDDGYTKEEHKMINETRKILGEPKLKITATTVRVPIENCHSESINVELKKSCSLVEILEVLRVADGVVLIEDGYPMPIIANGRDEVFVGRVRVDKSVKNGINLWVVADNLRKGAATNAIQILEKLIMKKTSKN